jgi:hypothetical protein
MGWRVRNSIYARLDLVPNCQGSSHKPCDRDNEAERFGHVEDLQCARVVGQLFSRFMQYQDWQPSDN